MGNIILYHHALLSLLAKQCLVGAMVLRYLTTQCYSLIDILPLKSTSPVPE